VAFIFKSIGAFLQTNFQHNPYRVIDFILSSAFAVAIVNLIIREINVQAGRQPYICTIRL
jgi:hypothetical protein